MRRLIIGLSISFLAPSLTFAQPALTIEPTIADMKYGDHERHRIDFYQAEPKGDGPTPLVVHIHGGGWNALDKSTVQKWGLKRLLDSGISVAAINYRYNSQAIKAEIKPPVQWPIGDAARAIQYLRSKSQELNIDPDGIAAQGGSAGACTSLWLALHDDLADPDSKDPIARQSTRLACVAVAGAQTSLDPKQMQEWIPNITYGPHAFGIQRGQDRQAAFRVWLERREELLPHIRKYSPYEHVSRDDPPIYLEYPGQKNPPKPGEEQDDPTHSAIFGVKLAERLNEVGVEVVLNYPGHMHAKYKSTVDFLIAKLTAVSGPRGLKP